MFDPYIFDKAVLDNGLTVYNRFLDRPFAVVMFIVHAGAREEIIPGIAHYTEHVAGDNVPGISEKHLKERFKKVGGFTWLGETTYIDTHYIFKVPTDNKKFTQKAFGYFGNMLLNGGVEKNFSKQGKLIWREFSEDYDILERIDWKIKKSQAIFHNCRKLRNFNDPGGTPETFKKITLDHVADFYNRFYTPSNITVISVGGYTTEEIINFLKNSPFSIKKEGKRNKPRQKFLEIEKPKTHELNIKASDFTKWTRDYTEFKSHWALPRSYIWEEVKIFFDIFDEFLNNELREKRGLAYYIDICSYDYGNVYEIVVEIKIDPKATTYTADIIKKCLSMVIERKRDVEFFILCRTEKTKLEDYNVESITESAIADIRDQNIITNLKDTVELYRNVRVERVQEIAQFLLNNGGFTFVLKP
jgi:predicted Zn-dependent peptidase